MFTPITFDLAKKRLYRYGTQLNTHDLLKIIAVILMIVDHVGELLLNDNLACRLLGRGAAPLFFFLIGYVNKLRITPSLIIYGILLSLTGFVFESHLWISILINFIAVDLLLKQKPIAQAHTLARSVLFLISTIATLFCYHYLEYGFLGFMIAYAGRLIAMKDKQGPFWLALSLLIYTLSESFYFPFISHLNYLVFFGLMMLGTYFVLRAYRLCEIPCPHFCLLPALCLSRYSLEIYFYHLIILQGIYFLKFFAR